MHHDLLLLFHVPATKVVDRLLHFSTEAGRKHPMIYDSSPWILNRFPRALQRLGLRPHTPTLEAGHAILPRQYAALQHPLVKLEVCDHCTTEVLSTDLGFILQRDIVSPIETEGDNISIKTEHANTRLKTEDDDIHIKTEDKISTVKTEGQTSTIEAGGTGTFPQDPDAGDGQASDIEQVAPCRKKRKITVIEISDDED